jgi:beta-xylosidase
MRVFLTALALLATPVLARPPSGAWMSDQSDGTYINPILNGDYSDPDVVRVGDDYYLTASSFTNMPGLPILHSKDLVNWEIIGHALTRLPPDGHFSAPRRGGGVWAPAIRHHDGKFLIYYPDPDYGIFVVTATDPAGPWSPPVLVDDTRGAIDPAPFWDDDGAGYLVFAYAGSRAGINNVIDLKRLNADGTRTEREAMRIIDATKLPPVETSQGRLNWQTTEGPKLYKRNGFYYIFAPSGGVKSGWQGVFRSKSITGPYEGRDVLDQGQTTINGPHQGAWVDTPSGEDWFVHFQDTDSYGRRVWLEPMMWGKNGDIKDWPVIGARQKGQTFGVPVVRHKKPTLPEQPVAIPIVDDEFDAGYHLGWQWSANPGDVWTDPAAKGILRLNSVSSSVNLWESPNLLTQKLPALAFSATTQISFQPKAVGERAGLLVLGYDYGWIGMENTSDGIRLVMVTRQKSNLNGEETTAVAPLKVDGTVWLRARFEPVSSDDPGGNVIKAWPRLPSTHARVTFSYSIDGVTFVTLGQPMTTTPGRWVGAQIGLFAQAASGTPAFTATKTGFADFDHFQIEK